jgi:hypothetical protein
VEEIPGFFDYCHHGTHLSVDLFYKRIVLSFAILNLFFSFRLSILSKSLSHRSQTILYT